MLHGLVLRGPVLRGPVPHGPVPLGLQAQIRISPSCGFLLALNFLIYAQSMSFYFNFECNLEGSLRLGFCLGRFVYDSTCPR